MDDMRRQPQPDVASEHETLARTVCDRCRYHGPWSSSAAAHIQIQMCLNCFALNTAIEVTTLDALSTCR